VSENTDTPELWDYTVEFYSGGEVYTVDVQLNLTRGQDAVQLSGDYDVVGVEVWTLVMEQAFAQEQGGYDEIDNGGHSDAVWELLTGESASSENLQGPIWQDSDQQVYDKIEAALDAGKGVMIGTMSSGSTVLHDNHAYSVLEVNAAGVVLYNPWGGDGATVTVPLADLNENMQTLYIGETP
jgi:hypothetical protein